MKTVYYITEEFLKKYTALTNNVDVSKIAYLIKLVYDIQINELLGSHFNEYMLQKFQDVMINKTDTFTTYERDLINIIRYTHAWAVCIKAVSDLSDTLYNKGLMKQSGEYEQPVNSYRVKMDEYNQNYEGYKRKLRNYLCENIDNFPEFKSSLNNDSEVKKSCPCNASINDLGIHII